MAASEEGVRFQPDMLGSLAYAGGLAVEDALNTSDGDGVVLGDELVRIGYAGDGDVGANPPHAFLEVHIEQGPVLEAEAISIGEIASYVREITRQLGGQQVGTVGAISLEPGVINVIPGKSTMTVDLRNTDNEQLKQAEKLLDEFLVELAASEGVAIESKRLARFDPVRFDDSIVQKIENSAGLLDVSCRRMTSGAGHDAQMMARLCPTAMIFVPSVAGVSHNPAEHTHSDDLNAGANVLLHTLLDLATA